MTRTVWRIVRDRYAATAFDGEGARLWGGRWNYPGTPMVYTSESLALAALEMFVNIEADIAPTDYVAVPAEAPDSLSIELLRPEDLPVDWRHFPNPDSLREIGSEWIESRRSVALLVPSAVIPQEHNLLLNPLHAEIARVRIGLPQPFAFDPRMWKTSGAEGAG